MNKIKVIFKLTLLAAFTINAMWLPYLLNEYLRDNMKPEINSMLYIIINATSAIIAMVLFVVPFIVVYKGNAEETPEEVIYQEENE